MTAKVYSLHLANDLETSLAQGQTLPATFYTDATIFAREQERIFKQSWHYVALLEQLTKPGDFVTCRPQGVPVVVLRDQENQLRAYVNVCGHRGAEIVLEECGNRKTLQCHYHAWTWGLDGELRSAPRSNQQECFNKNDFPLKTLQVETFGPFVFVNTSANPIAFQTLLGNLPQLIQDAGCNLQTLKRFGRRTYEIDANWKVVVENYLECYHCAVAHPGFTNLIDLDRYVVKPYDYYSVQSGPLKNSAKNPKEGNYDGRGGMEDGIYNYLWPNFMVNAYPGDGNCSTNLIIPISPNKTLAIYEFFYTDHFDAKQAEILTELIHQVQVEDVVICESVQRGLQSGFYDQGRLMLSHENGIQHFQQLVHRALR